MDLFKKAQFFWDPRKSLAKQWLLAANAYDEGLRANTSLNPQIVAAIIQERHRIGDRFRALLPDWKERISIVVTNETLVEQCAVSLLENHIYVLVSAAKLAYPIDHPEEGGNGGWDWLAHHEAAHVKFGHLPWLFHVRRIFRLTALFCCFAWPFFIGSNFLVWLFGGAWLIQTFVSLIAESQADRFAMQACRDQASLKEAETLLTRMQKQSIARPLGLLHYFISAVFIDPHLPLAWRRWQLRKKARFILTT